MKKVLILGDSLTLPRHKPEPCAYDDTWPVLLKKNFLVHHVALGGGTIKEIARQLPYHIAYEPDVVIIQSGIVDCAPRALGKLELEVMQQTWFTRKFILPFFKSNNTRLRRIRNKVYSTPSEYASHLGEIKRTLPGALVYALTILPTNQDYEAKVPGIGKRVVQYNSILQKQFGANLISLNDIGAQNIMSDHIHLNRGGHHYVYERIIAVIK
jgi:lysophospholipase L1-like esterase